MKTSRSWRHGLKILCAVIFIFDFDVVDAQTSFGENESGRGLRPGNQNDVVLHTCCDLGVDSNRRECPSILQPLGELQRLKEWYIPGHVTLDQTSMRVGLVKHRPSCGDPPPQQFQLDTGNVPPQIQFQPDGYLMIGNRTLADYVHPEYYCIEGISSTQISIRICKAKCTKEEPCVRKCCPRHQVVDLHLERRRCVTQLPPNSVWTPKLYAKPSNPSSGINLDANPAIKPRIQVRAPPVFQHNCRETPEGRPILQDMLYSLQLNLTPPNYEAHSFNARLGPNGKLYYRNESRRWEELPDNEYCSDGLTKSNDKSHVYRDTMDETLYIACGMRQEERIISVET